MGDFNIKMIKQILAVLISPLLYVFTLTFHDHLIKYPGFFKTFFLSGMVAFLLSYLFVHQFWAVYEFGKKVILGFFHFLAPLHRFIANIFSFYFIAVSAGFLITSKFFKIQTYDPYFIFFIGFIACMHILLTAQELQDSEKTFVKPEYFFTISIVYIVNICLMVLLMDLVIGKFTFPTFFKVIIEETNQMYFFTLKKFILM